MEATEAASEHAPLLLSLELLNSLLHSAPVTTEKSQGATARAVAQGPQPYPVSKTQKRT